MAFSPSRSAGIISLALTFFLTMGCTTSPISRIDANRALYESWPVEVQSAVLEGRAIKGMTPEMVRMALGEPTRIDARGGTTSVDESWIYSKGGGLSKLPLPNINLGGTVGGVGVSSGGMGGGSGTPEETEVIFQNGVVTRVN